MRGYNRPAAMADALPKAPRRLTKRFAWCLGRNAPTSACLWIGPGRRLAHNGLVGGSNPPGPTTHSAKKPTIGGLLRLGFGLRADCFWPEGDFGRFVSG